MSRLEFRAAVDASRPASAWLMVSVASAALWITDQLGPAVMAIQAGAIAFSLLRRERPLPWQTNALALNVGMIGVVGVTIWSAFRTGSSTIALAHFTALTQGLQLLDARPRKSEFLLVTLALFQVILAANLTDSVFFPVLLVIFTVATTWTLLVHTLRTEAIEAKDRHAASRAITPGLLRTTLFASVLSILLALMLFALLPRMRSSMIRAGSLASPVAMSGFSNRVELGAIGRIRSDASVVLRVETLDGDAPAPAESYWRGLAFDSFDGRRWAIDPATRSAVGGSPKFGVGLGGGPAREPLVQRVVREPVESGVLFGEGEVLYIQGALHRLETDPNGGLYAPAQIGERIRYTARTERHRPTDSELRC